ncbi:MAG: hypothetical protein ACI909_002548 [Planctomycetota bacterium]|jgi:hypothetical protein
MKTGGVSLGDIGILMKMEFIKFRITANTMNIICWTMLIGPAFIYFFNNILYSGLGVFWHDFVGVKSLYSVPILIILYILHEALHVLAGLICGLKLSSFSFGFDKRSFSIECNCKEEMSIKQYQVLLLLPFLVLTPSLVAIAVYSGSHLWWIMLVLSISGCAFDLTISVALIGIPGDTKIVPELKGENGYVYLRAAS